MYLVLFLIICCAFLPLIICNNNNSIVDACRNKSQVCNKLCEQGVCEIRAAVILPNDTNLAVSSLPQVVPLLERAINDAYELEILPKWINIKLIEKDDQCDASFAQIATIDSYSYRKENCVHVIFGPVCDYCLATVSRIVKFFGTPLLTAGGFSNDFDKDKKNCHDEYYMLVRTGKLVFKGLSRFFKRISERYRWSKVAFLYDKQGQREVAGENTCSLMMQTMADDLKDVRGFQYKDGDLGLSTFSIKDFLMREIGQNFGIILMCASRKTVNEILLAAAELGDMVYKGEYIFFNIELTNRATTDPDHPWIELNNTDIQRTNNLKAAYKNVKILTSLSEETYNNITNTSKIHEKSNYTSGFYDAMFLYLKTVNETLQKGGLKANENTIINGAELVRKMYNKTFTGLNGEVIIDSNGDRLTHYSLLSYNPDKDKFDIVENYTYTKEKQKESIQDFKVQNIYWHNSEKSPPDTPVCGYDNSKCKVFSPLIILVISSAVIIILTTMSIFLYKNYQLNKTLQRTYWKINQKDLIHLLRGSNQTLDQESAHNLGVLTCKYKNKITRLKCIPTVSPHNFSRIQLLHLNEMLDLHHENLVKFIGIYTDSTPNYVLTEYCSKGSLEDLLKDVNMAKIISESIIQKSFLKDIIFGMSYLHQSELKSHGALTSANCLVDNRLALKITDFGLQFLYKRLERGEQDAKYWHKMLYKAPELLKNPVLQGTQKGDVYSFAIIVHEMLERKGIFYLGEHRLLQPKDIIEQLKEGKNLRPVFVNSNDDITDLMKRCWAENEADRPDFSALKNTIKKLNRDHESGDMINNLLSRLEQYANNLEALVEERTRDYMEEKRKCEELLYQLLPREVAKQLISGNSVLAETYDQVTIYFSDIVGFTALSASSQPMEVVEFLNDLYTTFDAIIEHYDVYKVETIGDAYMVVSGLPVRNGNLHAREVARVALAVLKKVSTFRIKHRPKEQLRVRIGMHTGPCVAGVVGQKMPRYCLFGDTVNTASRMETNGEPLRIHVSPTTKEVLDTFGNFNLEQRGKVELKGKGTIITYWLNGEKQASSVSTSTASLSDTNSNTSFPPPPPAQQTPVVSVTSTSGIVDNNALSSPIIATNNTQITTVTSNSNSSTNNPSGVVGGYTPPPPNNVLNAKCQNGKSTPRIDKMTNTVYVINPTYMDSSLSEEDCSNPTAPLLSFVSEKKS